jgi:hypothetical protein
MAKQLPYRVTTASGEVIDVAFPLHDATQSPMRVTQLLSALLERIDREIAVLGETANGDVLQAVAMAIAVRAAMIHAPRPVTDRLALDLVRASLEAMDAAERSGPRAGHA